MSFGGNTNAAGALLIYGATGYTGRKLLGHAHALGLPVEAAGRDAVKLRALCEPLGVRWHVAHLNDATSLDGALRAARVVLHAAGPFAQTAEPMLQAALRCGVCYLDVSGEARTLQRASEYAAAARAARIMIMPAVGFDVVTSDCLARHVVARLPHATQLELGIFGLRGFSRGSALSMLREAGAPVLSRRAGHLVESAPGALRRRFVLEGAPHAAVAITWADVVSAWYSTGVPNITTYFELTTALEAAIAASRVAYALGTGPLAAAWLEPWLRVSSSEALLSADEAAPWIVAEARDAEGNTCSARLQCPEVYTATTQTAVAIAARVLRGDFEPGFETPARLYGADFILNLPGFERDDLA